MVEITFSVVLQLLQTVGILVGIVYYLTTMSNSRKASKTQIVSRIREQISSTEIAQIFFDLLEMEWKDFDDFTAKYDSTVDPENASKRMMVWGWYQELGYMIHEGLVDVDTVYNLIGGHNSLLCWTKFEPIILEQRKKFRDPSYFKFFEYFADEIKKYRVSQGIEAEITDADGYVNR